MDEAAVKMEASGFSLAGVERLVIRGLQRLALAAHALSVRLEGAAPSARCAALRTALSARAQAAHAALPEAVQHAVLMAGIFVCLLSFVFALPLLARLLLGGDPVLDTVPPPSAVYSPEDDPQADAFGDDDVQPQLVPASPTALTCVSPLSGAVLGHVAPDCTASVAAKVARARKAQPAWAATSFAARRRVLRVLRAYILAHQPALCGLSRLDTGKTMLDAALGEVLTTLEKIRWLLAEGEAALRPCRRSTGPLAVHKIAEVVYAPLGVIAAIAPWNYPLHNMLNPVLAALFAGNAVVVKPSEHTAFSSLHFARVARRALALCGHSAELVQIAVGGADVGRALVDADIDKLFFTGSTAVGRRVAAAAAERLLPTVLELGGKDPFVVCDDADLRHAAALCMRGVFQNSGQNCVGVERVFVHAAVKQQFLQIVLAKVAGVRVREDVGAMTMGIPAVELVQALVDDARERGATVLAGGKRAHKQDGGFFYEPTVLDGVTPDMRIAREEVFGPVMAVYEWESERELLDAVNGSRFGLGASVFTGDKRRARRIVDGLQVGMANVNDFAINYLCQSMPFGGTKDSGSDKFAGIEGLRGCCLVKSTTRDRFPGIRTNLPSNFAYPVAKNAFSLAVEINNLVYLPGIVNKIDALRNVVISLCAREWMPRETRADIEPFQ